MVLRVRVMTSEKEDFIAFPEHLLSAYLSGPIILVLDSYSNHTVHLVTAWLADHPRLCLFYLRTYCSHLNPLGPIWGPLNAKVVANRLYASMVVLLDTVQDLFATMAPEPARWSYPWPRPPPISGPAQPTQVRQAVS